MGKLSSGRVKRTPQTGITSDRYEFLGLRQAEPNLGDPLVGPSSIGANQIKVGAFYQLAAIAEYPGERYWSTQVGIGTTLGIISVYANGELPNNAFGRIHGLNFVGTGVTVETPSVDFIGDVGIATIRFAITDVLNQGQVGQVLYNGPNGVAIGATDLNYYNGNVGIGTSRPNAKLDVWGQSDLSGASLSGITTLGFFSDAFYLNRSVTLEPNTRYYSVHKELYVGAGYSLNIGAGATIILDRFNNLDDVTADSLIVSGISTLGNIKISSGIVTASIGTATYYGNLIGIADFATTAGIAYTIYADVSGFSTSSGIATNVIGGIASVTSLRVSGISTLGNTSATQLNISGISTLGGIKISAGIITATTGIVTYYGRFIGTLEGPVDNAGYAKTAGVSTSVIGGIASVTQLNVTGFSTLANVYVGNTITGPSTIYIDPTVVGDDTGKVVIKGDLNVNRVSTLGFVTATDAFFIGVVTATKFDGEIVGEVANATYARKAGVATDVIGGIASVTSLSVSGISTLGGIQISAGIVTATPGIGIVTYYGRFVGTADFATAAGIAYTIYADVSGFSTTSGISTNIKGGLVGNIPYQTGNSATTFLANGTEGTFLKSNGVGAAPSWFDLSTGFNVSTADYATNAGISTNIKGGATGNIPYQTGNSATTFLANGTSGTVLRSNGPGNAPSWAPSSAIGAANTISILGDNSNQNQSLTYVTGIGDTTLGISILSSNALIFNPSTGNLGIGNNNPGEKLQVDGNLRVGGSSTSNYIAFRGTLNDGVNASNDGDQNPELRRWQHTYIGERIYDGGERSELLLFKGNDNSDTAPVGPDRIRLVAAEFRFDTWTGNSEIVNGTFEQVATDTSTTNKMILTGSGSLGIGVANPTQKLHVIGNILASGTVTGSSDIKLKTNIQTIPNSLDKVLQLRGVEFDRIDMDGEHQIGVIAQEVEKIIPEVVMGEDGTKSVAYGNIVAVLIEAIKELTQRVIELENK